MKIISSWAFQLHSRCWWERRLGKSNGSDSVLEFTFMTSFQDISLGTLLSWEYLGRKTALPPSQAEKKEIIKLNEKQYVLIFCFKKRCAVFLCFLVFLSFFFFFATTFLQLVCEILWPHLETQPPLGDSFNTAEGKGWKTITSHQKQQGAPQSVESNYWDGNGWLGRWAFLTHVF